MSRGPFEIVGPIDFFFKACLVYWSQSVPTERSEMYLKDASKPFHLKILRMYVEMNTTWFQIPNFQTDQFVIGFNKNIVLWVIFFCTRIQFSCITKYVLVTDGRAEEWSSAKIRFFFRQQRLLVLSANFKVRFSDNAQSVKKS